MTALVAFALGFAAFILVDRTIERMAVPHETELTPAELEAGVPWGGLLGAGALLLHLAAFGLGVWVVVFVVRRTHLSMAFAFISPLVFFLTMDLAVAVYEIAFGITPRIGRPITFSVGGGLRRRGLIRATVCVTIVGAVLVATALA